MEEGMELSEQESLAIITQMIRQAKCDYRETGVAALMWGSIVTFCSLVSFINAFWNLHWVWANWVWLLTLAALVPQVIISTKDRKAKQFATHTSNAMGGIWISFGITIFLLSIYMNLYHPPYADALSLIAYGIPTFATGYARRFIPMTLGGIACWAFAIACMFVAFPYSMLFVAAAAQLAWFVPGLILRSNYLKAKSQHV